MMASLLFERTSLQRPFINTCVDFEEPFDISTDANRGSSTTKVYVSLFICCATKAIHLKGTSECDERNLSFAGKIYRLIK